MINIPPLETVIWGMGEWEYGGIGEYGYGGIGEYGYGGGMGVWRKRGMGE